MKLDAQAVKNIYTGGKGEKYDSKHPPFFTGWLAVFNSVTILMARSYGGTREGHKNGRELSELMEKELVDVRKKVFFLGSYFYSTGRKPL